MKSFLFSVLPPSARGIPSFETTFALQQDHWNDFGFLTQYHLYAKLDSSPPELIGPVKILRKNQTAADPILIQNDFDFLENDFISVGESLDYYQRLNRLPYKKRIEVLKALQDAVYSPEMITFFENEKGWNTSVFRGRSESGISRVEQQQYLKEATAILSGIYTELPDISEELRFAPSGWAATLSVTFDAPRTNVNFAAFSTNKKVQENLPHRCAVLIGPNGSGKSTVLSRLARVAFASPSERVKSDLQSIGNLEPAGLGFLKLITISYSAFDSFTLPGVYADDLEQIAKDVERGEGRFFYCGLRDIVKEVREDLRELAQKEVPASDQRRRLPVKERRDNIHLKNLDALAGEFVRNLELIASQKRNELLENALEPLIGDRSFAGLEERTANALIGSNPKSAFLSWSTGHKIALHVITSIVAHAQARCLVLFDEPETHLHPPMIAAVMHGYRRALEGTGALSIIATHSPVILQETLSKHVRVVRRIGDKKTISQPSSETFGENIGTLVYDTFGLTASDTDFHDVLDHLIDTSDSLEKIEAYFEPGLSAQSRAYVIAGLAKKHEGKS